MTLNSADILKIQRLYKDLEWLQAHRRLAKDAVIDEMTGHIKRGTSGIENVAFRDLSTEAMKEIRDVLARDIRRRAAKIVDALHKFGCEAKLTEE